MSGQISMVSWERAEIGRKFLLSRVLEFPCVHGVQLLAMLDDNLRHLFTQAIIITLQALAKQHGQG